MKKNQLLKFSISVKNATLNVVRWKLDSEN